MVFPAHRLDLRPHRLISEAAKRQPERRAFLLNCGDDRFGRANGIAGLGAAVGLDLLPARDRGLRVGVDRLLRCFQGAAGPIGAEGAGLDDDDLDSQRRDFLRQRLGEPLDGELRRRVITRTGKTDEAANRGDVDDRPRLFGRA